MILNIFFKKYYSYAAHPRKIIFLNEPKRPLYFAGIFEIKVIYIK